MVITISCPSCAASFPVDPAKIPEAGVNVRCSQCSHVFRVERPAEPEPEPVVEAPAEPEPMVEESPPEPVVEDATWDEAPADAADDWVVETEDEGTGGMIPDAPAAESPDAGSGVSSFFGSSPAPAAPAEEEEAPSFDEPSFDEPSFDEPAFDEPSFDEPAFDEPSFDEPVVEPAAEGPSFDAPGAEAPSFDEPVVEPAAEESTFDEPVVEAEPAEPEPEAEPAEEPAAPAVQGFSFGQRDPLEKAKRLARVLVSDMIMYNPERHERALANNTLKEDFEEEIEKSYKEYVEQVGDEIAESTDFWPEALNDVLAKGESVF